MVLIQHLIILSKILIFVSFDKSKEKKIKNGNKSDYVERRNQFLRLPFVFRYCPMKNFFFIHKLYHKSENIMRTHRFRHLSL
jgi:hypothetical protein